MLNIQGDEPFLAPAQIDDLLSEVLGSSQRQDIGIATLAKQIEEVAWLENENVVKVVMNHHREAMYFSRAKVPHARLLPPQAALKRFAYYKHIGLYLYRINILKQLVLLQPTFLEEVEALEQLRWMSHGYKIRVALTNHQSINIDTPEDLQRAIADLWASLYPPLRACVEGRRGTIAKILRHLFHTDQSMGSSPRILHKSRNFGYFYVLERRKNRHRGLKKAIFFLFFPKTYHAGNFLGGKDAVSQRRDEFSQRFSLLGVTGDTMRAIQFVALNKIAFRP